MRATRSQAQLAGVLLLGAALTGCARSLPAAPAAVEELGGGLFRLAATGPTASAAVEAGLNQATRHCAARNAMIAVEGTQIEARAYQLRFRCLETGTPGAGTPGPLPAPAAGPVSAVTGAPLAAPATVTPAAEPPRSSPLLPGATRALPPIAAGRPAAAPRTEGAPAMAPQTPSSFWRSGR